jgi:hydrogenase/urease accessory protein HupE
VRWRAALLVAGIAGIAGTAGAHELRPGYLELRQTGEETFDVIWKVPARGEMRLGIRARLPEHCADITPPTTRRSPGAYLDRRQVTCPGGLAGSSISIDGLDGTRTDVLVRIERQNGTTQIARLTPAATSFVVESEPSAAGVAGTYAWLGVEHILLGIDHLLFVLALLLLVRRRARLVATVTAFTVAHSLTLAAATLGFVRVPQSPVEAVIALSIVFVAGEIVHAREGRPGITERRPWIVAFVFGLLHGFGFAGALSEVGLPQQAIPLALLFFNVGVELGQLAFIAAVLALAAAARRLAVPYPSWSWRVPAYAIGTIAVFWTIERVAGFV